MKLVERVVSFVRSNEPDLFDEQLDKQDLFLVQLDEQGVCQDTVAVATAGTHGSCHGEIEGWGNAHLVPSLVQLRVEWASEQAVPALEGRGWSADAGKGRGWSVDVGKAGVTLHQPAVADT